MAILRPVIIPSLGLPTQIVAPSRKQSRLDQPKFYKNKAQNPQIGPEQSDLLEATAAADNTIKPPEQKFYEDPNSSGYVAQQLASYADRKAVPQLTPGSRVKGVDDSLVSPDNFKDYYNQLNLISQMGSDMTAATAARSAFQKNQALSSVLNQQVGSGGGGGTAVGSIPSNPKANFQFAQEIAPNYGWGANDLAAWYTLGMKESGWNNNAQNPTSTAYGIGQFLNSTWGSYGIPKTSDPKLQVEAMARYIKARYGSPSAALAFHNAHNWY